MTSSEILEYGTLSSERDIFQGPLAWSPPGPVSSDAASGAPKPVENGSVATTATVAASGNQAIDGLLDGVRWLNSRITYSDPDSVSDYQAGHPEAFTGFHQMTAQQMVAVHFALNATILTQPAGAAGFSVEGFTNLATDYAGTGLGTGTIRVANTTDPATAYAYYPDNGVSGGDAFFGPSGDLPTAGNYDWHSVIHELGHALGLKHGHETDVYGALPSDVDSLEFSVMTYHTYIGDNGGAYTYETWGAPQTFMMLDIAALQYMYGADFTTNGGNTTYTWSPTTGETFVNGTVAIDPGGNRIFATLWDGGGVDTYDLSNYTTNLNLDLTPGGYSVFSPAQLAYLGGGPNDGYARGNIFNALQYNGDARSLIENASGGSGNDTIHGNAANNTLSGNAGADTLTGDVGNDVLVGGSGADVLDGGAGTDTASYAPSTGGVNVNLTTGAGVAFEAQGDTLTGIERLIGGSGGDWLRGDGNANTLTGNSGNDTLQGFGGLDSLNGGNGNDTLSGGAGKDTLAGGTGADRFVYSATGDSPVGGSSTSDAITDFSHAQGDRIDLSAIDANSGVAGDQAFSFIGAAAFAHHAGELRYASVSAVTSIYGDINGDGTADFQIRLSGAIALAAADFVL